MSLPTAGISPSTDGQGWRVRAGALEFALRREGDRLVHTGAGPLASGLELLARYGAVERVRAEQLRLVELRPAAAETPGGLPELRAVLADPREPAQLELVYAVDERAGVLLTWAEIVNTGRQELPLHALASGRLALRAPRGATLTYLHGHWGDECQVASEVLGFGTRTLEVRAGRSSNGFSPWFALQPQPGLVLAGQLAWSGNWRIDLAREDVDRHRVYLYPEGGMPEDGDPRVVVTAGLHDWRFLRRLAPGERFRTPVLALAAGTDLDAAAQRLHTWSAARIPQPNPNVPLQVQFNTWYNLGRLHGDGKVPVGRMKAYANVAAEIGCEIFVLDAGWYDATNWSGKLGDWEVDPTFYPNGLEELIEHVRGKGMKFGLWVEIEVAGAASRLRAEHPDWLVTHDGEPLAFGRWGRRGLAFGHPEAAAWALAELDRLATRYQLDWLKIDYNIDYGPGSDNPRHGHSPGDALYRHLTAYYAILDELRRRHPNLIVENCASGGLRFDPGIIAHTHTTWLSDEVRPLRSLQLGYGATLAHPAAVCNHWAVDLENEMDPIWRDLVFRVPMMGQFGISGNVDTWDAGLRAQAAHHVAVYKQIREVVRRGRCYHLTPPIPPEGATGWTAIWFVDEVPAGEAPHGVLFAYRLAESPAEIVLPLPGLAAEGVYKVRADRELDGISPAPAELRSGASLAEEGLRLRLPAVNRSALVQLRPAEG